MNLKITHEIPRNPLSDGLRVNVDEKNSTYSVSSNMGNLKAQIVVNKIFLSGIGNVEVWIKRNEKDSKLISPSHELISIEGPVEDKDEFYFLVASIKVLSLKAHVELPSNLPQLAIKDQPTAPIKTISPIRMALASSIDKILSILPQKENYVRRDLVNPQNSKNKKLASILGVMLLFLLIISIVFGNKQKKILNLKSQYEPILTSIDHDLTEAENLSSVNNAKARELILSSRKKIEELNYNDPKIDELKKRIETDLGGIAGVFIVQPTVFLDLTLLNNSFVGGDLAANSNRLLVLDKKGRRLESVDISTGKVDPVSIPDILPNVHSISIYSDRNFVSADNGIWEIGDGVKIAVPSENNFGDNILIINYAGNIYVLDKNTSSLWRFTGEGGSFKTKENWLAEGIKPDLSNVIAWAVDGNIWMLTQSKVLRFASGNPLDFNIKGTDKPVNATDIYTNEDNKYIYLLDNSNSRVLVIDKEGNYKAQYLSDDIKNTTKIIASETAKKIILLEKDKLLSLEMKHLNQSSGEVKNKVELLFALRSSIIKNWDMDEFDPLILTTSYLEKISDEIYNQTYEL